MTYFSDFDLSTTYDNPSTRERVLWTAEEEYLQDAEESVPWDLLEQFDDNA